MKHEHFCTTCGDIVPPVDAFMTNLEIGKVICTECKNDEFKAILMEDFR